MVAIDLVGPFSTAIDGSKYAVVLHNIFSQLTSVSGLKSKADAPTAILKWIVGFERLSLYTVKAIWSDNAGELTSKKFSEFLGSRSIYHEMTVPYKHHQNGLVGRNNRSLLDMAQTSLLHAKLPQSFWMLALKQSAYIFNRVVHAKATMTP